MVLNISEDCVFFCHKLTVSCRIFVLKTQQHSFDITGSLNPGGVVKSVELEPGLSCIRCLALLTLYCTRAFNYAVEIMGNELEKNGSVSSCLKVFKDYFILFSLNLIYL